MTASLEPLSGGRLRLGIGVGWSGAEFDPLDQDFHTRGRRTDEALDIFDVCWNQGPSSYSGTHYSFTDIRVLAKPVHPIEIWIGGASSSGSRRLAYNTLSPRPGRRISTPGSPPWSPSPRSLPSRPSLHRRPTPHRESAVREDR